MMNLLVLKERIKILYQKSELYMQPAVKFLVAFAVFMIINKQFGYDARLNSIPVVLILSLLCAFTPSSILVLLAAAVSVGHVYAASKILSIIVIFIFLILYVLFARLTPKQGYIILALPVLYFLKIPYVIPILMGVASAPISIIPVSCGVIVFYMFDVIRKAAEINTKSNIQDTLTLYKFVIDNLINNKLMIFTLAMFIVVILVTYFIRRIKMDYAFDVSILAGGVVMILGFLIGDLGFEVSDKIGSMILGIIVSMVIVYIIQFFRLTLDYTGVERVQFEDDDYYYYVKAVPKINVTTPKKNVKRINPQKIKNYKSESYGTNDKMDDMENDLDNFDPYDSTKDNHTYYN
jgi:hypothetical protein